VSITALSRSPSQRSTIECAHSAHKDARGALSALQEAYDQWPLGCPEAPKWRARIRFAIDCGTEREATALLRGDTRSYERLWVSAALLAALARQAQCYLMGASEPHPSPLNDSMYRRAGSTCDTRA